jgi:hypothetical protein
MYITLMLVICMSFDIFAFGYSNAGKQKRRTRKHEIATYFEN